MNCTQHRAIWPGCGFFNVMAANRINDPVDCVALCTHSFDSTAKHSCTADVEVHVFWLQLRLPLPLPLEL
jgi:hypothetical protein